MAPSKRQKKPTKTPATCSLCTHATSSCTCSQPSPAAPAATRPRARLRNKNAVPAAPPPRAATATACPTTGAVSDAALAAAEVSVAALAAPSAAPAPAPALPHIDAAAAHTPPAPASNAATATSVATDAPSAAAVNVALNAAAVESALPDASTSSSTSDAIAPSAALTAAVAAARAGTPVSRSVGAGSTLDQGTDAEISQTLASPSTTTRAPLASISMPQDTESLAESNSKESESLQTRKRRRANDEEGDEDEEEENEKEGDSKMSESKSRHLWLSTVDALQHVKTLERWEFITDDKKRARLVREKYWRLVKEAAILSHRTGIHIFLAAGRSDRVTQGLKEHVFVSEDLCNPANLCLHDTANVMADTWSKGLNAYRETLIAQNKAKDDLLRQHQAQFLVNQRKLQEQEEALTAALAASAALQAELDRLRSESGSSDPALA
ncbi:hypothetical protein CF319_g8783 [Tilletia indica]|nr:hypothetical protein CF319_g8783 [Tilletia indica]